MFPIPHLAALGLAAALAAALAANAGAAEFRVEGGAGWTHADHDAENTGGSLLLTGEVEGFGGSGPAAQAAVWGDNLFMPNLSMGFEYLFFGNGSEATFTDKGDRNDFDADLTLHAAMANIAWRLNEGRIHPFIGGGIGAAFVDFSGERTSTSAGIVTVSDFDESETVLAWQVFGGFDYDLSERIYVGVSGRYFAFNGDPFGADVDLREISLMGHVGLKF